MTTFTMACCRPVAELDSSYNPGAACKT